MSPSLQLIQQASGGGVYWRGLKKQADQATRQGGFQNQVWPEHSIRGWSVSWFFQQKRSPLPFLKLKGREPRKVCASQ